MGKAKEDKVYQIFSILDKVKQRRDKGFLENRVSWKWFDRLWKKEYGSIQGRGAIILPGAKGYTERVLIEILKELQHLNDKK